MKIVIKMLDADRSLLNSLPSPRWLAGLTMCYTER